MMWIYGLFLILAFIGTEFFSWFIHKYIMHGILWRIHRTHHEPNQYFFELNDLFSVFFASISIALIVLGVPDFDGRFWVGLGIASYGMTYFVLHDVFIHRRIKVFKRSKSSFLQSILKAHQAHHKTHQRDGSESFGLFCVPKKFHKKS